MCSKNESSVRIDLKRCPCIHSLAQLVDVTLQSLLYQRQMIPEPASTLLHGCTPVAEQFRTTYQKVQQILRNTFRTANGDGRIREFVILVGATPFSPKEIYRVRVPRTVCRPSQTQKAEKIATTPEGRRTSKQSSENDETIAAAVGDGNNTETDGTAGGDEMASTKCRCGGATVCDALNAKERRLVFSAVALSKTAVAHFEGCKVPGKMEKVFMFIRTSDPLVDCASAEGLEEDDSFEVPDREMKRRRKIRQLRIQVNAPCIVQQQKQPQKRQRNGEETETTIEENDENVAQGEERGKRASGGGGRPQRQQRRRRQLQQQQQRRTTDGGDNGRTTPTATAGEKEKSEQYTNNNNEDNDHTHCNNDEQQHDDDGDGDEQGEEEEMAFSSWYRLCPFFTNLS